MFEVSGKYNSCKIFSDTLDETAAAQLKSIMNESSIEGSKIRIMPDYYSGKGSVIGTTMTLHNKVIPNVVGIDIGCGMLAVKLKEKRIDLPALDSVIRKYVPFGFNVHEEPIADSSIDEMYCASNCNLKLAERSLGSLGSGNHFIEIDKGEDGSLWLVIHTGSRHLGLEVCEYYQNLGYQRLKEKNIGGSYSEVSKKLVEEYKAAGREKEPSKALADLKSKFNATEPDTPYVLAWVEGEDFEHYLHDMALAQEHASINRATIAKIILKKAKLHEVDRFETIHNYVSVEESILRKGAVSARDGEKLIIPMNMRDGSLICIGKGNEDWNYSAPHGAGRVASRNDARNSISMAEYKNSMKGIYSSCINTSTLDESPMAYKSMNSIIDCIGDTVSIVERIVPIYNFKASE